MSVGQVGEDALMGVGVFGEVHEFVFGVAMVGVVVEKVFITQGLEGVIDVLVVVRVMESEWGQVCGGVLIM